jgi:hypothetical protein
MKLAHRMDSTTIDWKKLQYKVFDLPTHPGLYQDRYLCLGKMNVVVVVLKKMINSSIKTNHQL